MLEDPAREWFWTQRRMGKVSTWPELSMALKEQYQHYEDDSEISGKMYTRRQLYNESFEDYVTALVKLRNQQRKPMDEKTLARLIKSNVNADMTDLLFAIQPTSLSQICKEGRRAESTLKNKRQHSGRYQGKHVHELEYDISNREAEVDAIAAGKKLQCWNCKDEGHTFNSCLIERGRFCFKCGLENTISTKCKVCQGNQRTNVPQTGLVTRSKDQDTQTPNQ